MHHILILGSGGAPGIGVIRSLKNSPEQLKIIGTEVDKYSFFRSEAHKTYLTPFSSAPDSFKVIAKIIKTENIDFIHAQPEKEVLNISKNRHILDELNVKYFLPKHETILSCQDKFKSYEIWAKAGLNVPATILIKDENDLKIAFKDYGPKIWLRETIGGGGKGSLPTDNFQFAKFWLDYHNGWGKFTGAEILSSQSTTWSSIWNKGELIVAQSRKRLFWEYGSKTLSGVTGITGTGVTIDDPYLNEIAQNSILAIDSRPHGIYSVDLTEGVNGKLYLTEINIGRFFTTINFFTEAGLNMPFIILKLAHSESIEIVKKINPLKTNLYWIRGMDMQPNLVDGKLLDELDIFKE